MSIRVGNSIQAGDFLRARSDMQRNLFDIRFVDGHHRMAAAIGTSGAVHLLLHFSSQDLEGLVGVVVGREVAAKGEIFFRLRGSEPKNFSQVGNHAYRYSCTYEARLRPTPGTERATSRANGSFLNEWRQRKRNRRGSPEFPSPVATGYRSRRRRCASLCVHIADQNKAAGRRTPAMRLRRLWRSFGEVQQDLLLSSLTIGQAYCLLEVLK